jgi:hypothetical protein
MDGLYAHAAQNISENGNLNAQITSARVEALGLLLAGGRWHALCPKVERPSGMEN